MMLSLMCIVPEIELMYSPCSGQLNLALFMKLSYLYLSMCASSELKAINEIELSICQVVEIANMSFKPICHSD